MVHTIDLSGKNVLVTGGGRGLGVSIARAYAKAGAHVALTYNSTPAEKLAAAMAEEFGVKVLAYKLPAGDSKLVDAAITTITADFGELDIIIANVGMCTHVLTAECTDEQLRETFETNTFFPFFLARAAYASWFPPGTPADAPKKDKRIVLVSSISGRIVNTPQQQLAYNASKAALTHLGRTLAGDWAARGVCVNSVSPGYLDSDMSLGSRNGQRWQGEWLARTPVGFFATPEQVAETVLFLGSDMASFMTGSDVVADGGYTIF